MNQNSKESSVLDRIAELKLVPVVVLNDAKDAVPLAQALCEGGLPCAEVTYRTEAANESIRQMTTAFPDMLIGAGTVLTTQQVDSAVLAGAKFIVSPGFNPRIVKYCLDKGIPVIPGTSSPSDIEQALELGLDTVKFFPAEAAGGLKMIKAMAAPYTNMRFMPTGGINADNLCEYLSFSRIIACGGSWMVKDSLIREGQFDKVRRLTREAVQKIKEMNSGSKDAPGSKPAQKKAVPSQNPAPLSQGVPSSSKKVVTFGEIMLRLAPEGYYRFVQADKLGATYGGGEANVAVSLAGFGFPAAFVTRLPAHEIGQAAVNSLRRYGVDTSCIVRGGDRVGIYFLEKGASQRPSKVIYDRAGSAIATASPEDFNWSEIFRDAAWFHFTGITPALNDTVAAICLEACKAAKAAGLTVSCDLNYRGKLWSREKAGQVMSQLCNYVDVCIANEEDAADVFGIRASNTDVTSGEVNHEGYKEVAVALAERFGFRQVAITLRESLSANDNNWSAMLYDTQNFYFSKKYKIHIVDRVGGGDSFGGGLIAAMLSGYAPQNAIEFAVAASCLKHSVEGDFNMVSMDEVEKLAGGDASGRVQR